MAMLGEQFMVGEEICGAVVSVRFNEDILSVWNRTANDTAITNRIRDTFRRVLNLPQGTVIEYKAHNDSIRYDLDFSRFFFIIQIADFWSKSYFFLFDKK